MPAERFDPQAALAVLQEHGVLFVAIGGYAAILQGSPYPTTDVDITPETSSANLDRLAEALRALDARVRHPDTPEGLPFACDATALAAAIFWNLTTRYGDLDIFFTPAGTHGYPDLVRDAVTIELRGVPVRVAHLADVIRSKDAANRDKDRRVLPVLRQVLDRQERP
ncbi:MAG: hypothetical protein JWM62_482 [Frankiales bacterium]|nr:hypothetical protein [Frankiales bacterium]